MPWFLFGGIFVTVGSALMHSITEFTRPANIYGYSVLVAVGSGSFVQASFSVSQAKVRQRDVALASGFIACAQAAGTMITVSIANAVFLNASKKSITKILPNAPEKVVESIITGVNSDFFDALKPVDKAEVLHAIVKGIGKTYIMGITAGALTALLSLFMNRERLFGEKKKGKQDEKQSVEGS
jgi:hypothetical protein